MAKVDVVDDKFKICNYKWQGLNLSSGFVFASQLQM